MSLKIHEFLKGLWGEISQEDEIKLKEHINSISSENREFSSALIEVLLTKSIDFEKAKKILCSITNDTGEFTASEIETAMYSLLKLFCGKSYNEESTVSSDFKSSSVFNNFFKPRQRFSNFFIPVKYKSRAEELERRNREVTNAIADAINTESFITVTSECVENFLRESYTTISNGKNTNSFLKELQKTNRFFDSQKRCQN